MSKPINPAREYVLGTNQAELERLGFQHRIWSSFAHDLWARAGIGPGLSVLDVGCGPGYAAQDLARLVTPTGRVLGVDESEPYVEHLNAQARALHMPQLSAVVGDVQKLGAAGVEHGAFDLAWSRWVLCFVADPDAVVAGIAHGLRPGGRFMIQDYFQYRTMSIAPRSTVFETVIQAVDRSWRDRGGNPDVMELIPAFCRQHGMDVTYIGAGPRVARPGSTLWHWPDVFWRIFLPRLEDMGYITADQRVAFLDAWKRASDSPDSFMLLPPVVELIAVKR